MALSCNVYILIKTSFDEEYRLTILKGKHEGFSDCLHRLSQKTKTPQREGYKINRGYRLPY